jgi:excisionase family DNA binding protein
MHHAEEDGHGGEQATMDRHEEHPPLLLTMAETEKLLRLDDNSIRKLLAAGEIQAIKIGRSLRIIYQSIVDYIERKRNG